MSVSPAARGSIPFGSIADKAGLSQGSPPIKPAGILQLNGRKGWVTSVPCTYLRYHENIHILIQQSPHALLLHLRLWRSGTSQYHSRIGGRPLNDFVDAAPNWPNQYPPPKPRSRGRWLLIGGIALALLLTLGVGALLGSHIGTAQAASVTSSGANSQGVGFTPGGPISFQTGGGTLANTAGPQGQCERLTVTAVSGSTITAKAANGNTVTVHTTASTEYTRSGQSVSASAVTVGSTISVMGTHNSDGSITATSINIG